MRASKTAGIFGELSLARQGLLLVAVLLFLELFFVGTLAWQVQVAEQEAAREEHYKQIVERTQNLANLVADSMDSLKRYAMSRDKKYSLAFDRNSKAVFDSLAWLREQLKSNRRSARLLNNIDKELST
ncbi:MAG: hypothetical protein K2X27_10510, partial [Candidatus Obscuribacterales bacterium]|nr:hypothetical protein [Candidatus Obscuribacterales bacterium]